MIEKIEKELRAELSAVTGGPFDTPWRRYRTAIFGTSFDGGDSRVADVRGWGYLTGKGHGALGLDPDEASKVHDALGDFIARCSPERLAELPDFMVALSEWGCEDPNEQAAAITDFLNSLVGMRDYLDSPEARALSNHTQEGRAE